MVNKILANYEEKVYDGPNGDALFRLDLVEMQEEHDREICKIEDSWIDICNEEAEELKKTIEDLIEQQELKEQNEE
jgi:hypothetical protein